MAPALTHHSGWNTGAGVEAALRAWREDHPILLTNPAVAELPGVKRWLEPLLQSGGGPLLEGLRPGFHVLLLTSGTTGEPRLVALDRASVLWNTGSIARHLALPTDGSLTAVLQVPCFHAFGLVLTLFLAETLGGRVMVLERFSPEGLRRHLEALASEGGAPHLLLPFVPTMIRALPGALPRFNLRGTAIVGGDRVRWEDLRVLHDHLPNVAATVGYGLTEAGPALTHTSTLRASEVPAPSLAPSLGLPLPGVTLLPPDSAAHDPTAGWHFQSPGQAVALRGPGDSDWRSTGKSTLSSGDRLRVDAQTGELHFEGRASWCFKWQGETLSPILLEEALRDAEPRLPEFVVLQGEDGAPILWVESSESEEVRAAFLRAQSALPAFFQPRALRWTEALPRNALGKVSRS